MTINNFIRGEGQQDCDDQDARHRRNEEREADRAAQRDRELMCLPLEDWPIEHQRDLEYEIAQAAKAARLHPAKARRSFLRSCPVNPFTPVADTSDERP